MWLKKRILVPTDFEKPSQAAADIGVELAQTFRVPLVLLHTYSAPQAFSGVPLSPAEDYALLYEKTVSEFLDKERARLAPGNTEVVSVLRRGVVWEEILAAAQELDVDLIVMGTHGRRGLPRALLGSVAEKVVRISPIPVLTVHGRSDAPPAASR